MMQDTMLEEAIYKFKVSGPTIMPSLFDNFFLKETEECNGYAILTYDVNRPLPIDEVLNIMDGDAYMRILYYTHPNPAAIKTKFGQRACTYFMPEEQRNIKMNFSTDELPSMAPSTSCTQTCLTTFGLIQEVP